MIPLAQPENGSVGQNEASKHETTGDLNQVNPLFAPALLHNSKGLPVRPVRHIYGYYWQKLLTMVFIYYIKGKGELAVTFDVHLKLR